MSFEIIDAPRIADLLSPELAARELGVAPATLAAWWARGTGPAFHKLGSKLVRYTPDDLRAFVAGSRKAREEQPA